MEVKMPDPKVEADTQDIQLPTDPKSGNIMPNPTVEARLFCNTVRSAHSWSGIEPEEAEKSVAAMVRSLMARTLRAAAWRLFGPPNNPAPLAPTFDVLRDELDRMASEIEGEK